MDSWDSGPAAAHYRAPDMGMAHPGNRVSAGHRLDLSQIPDAAQEAAGAPSSPSVVQQDTVVALHFAHAQEVVDAWQQLYAEFRFVPTDFERDVVAQVARVRRDYVLRLVEQWRQAAHRERFDVRGRGNMDKEHRREVIR